MEKTHQELLAKKIAIDDSKYLTKIFATYSTA
jgi:hypothetical protein